MRASGSHSVTLRRRRAAGRRPPRRLPASATPVPYIERNLDRRPVPRLGHARHRRERARARDARSSAQRGANGNGRDGRARRREHDRARRLPRRARARRRRSSTTTTRRSPTSDGTDDELTALFAEAQAAKAFISQAAPRIVDRALALSGGAGYLNGVAARPRLPRRPGRRLHAPARRQPGLRVPRPGRPRPGAGAALSAMRDDSHRHHRRRPGRPRAQPVPRARAPRARAARARPGRRTLAIGAVGIAVAPDAELVQPAAGVRAARRARRVSEPRRVRRLPRGVRALLLCARARGRVGAPGRPGSSGRLPWCGPTPARGTPTTSCSPPATPTSRSCPPWPPPPPTGSSSFTPAATAHPGGCRPAACSSSARARAASSWPPSSGARDGGWCSPSAATHACRAATADTTSGTGSPSWAASRTPSPTCPMNASASRSPSLALSGAGGGEQLDLTSLAAAGVVVTGRLRGFSGRHALFAADLRTTVEESDRRMRRLLEKIDRHIDAAGAPSRRPPSRSRR